MKFKLSGKKEWYLAVLIIVVGNLLGMGMAAVEKRSAKTDYLERNPYGEGAYEETLQVELEGKQEEIQIYVEEQKYTEADKKRYLKEAEKELNTWFQRVCGDKGEIRQSLSFPDKLEQNPVTLSWSTSQPQILDWEGVLGTGVAPKAERGTGISPKTDRKRSASGGNPGTGREIKRGKLEKNVFARNLSGRSGTLPQDSRKYRISGMRSFCSFRIWHISVEKGERKTEGRTEKKRNAERLSGCTGQTGAVLTGRIQHSESNGEAGH